MKSSGITLSWASSLDRGQAKHISEVKKGLLCACVCPGCGAALEAVNSQNPRWKKRPHFRHHKVDEAEGCGEAAFKVGAREAFKSMGEISIPSQHRENTKPVLVVSFEFTDATDAVLTLADGQRVLVRLIATSKFESNSPVQQELPEILIDISDPLLRYAPPEELRKHIGLTGNRRWCARQDDPVAKPTATNPVAKLRATDPREHLKALRQEFLSRIEAMKHTPSQLTILERMPRPINVQKPGFWLDTRSEHAHLVGRDLAKWMELHPYDGI